MLKMITKGYVKGMDLKEKVQASLRNEEGQTGTEYGVILTIVLIASIGALVAFRNQVGNVVQNITNGIMTR